jgi:hypothetical protein
LQHNIWQQHLIPPFSKNANNTLTVYSRKCEIYCKASCPIDHKFKVLFSTFLYIFKVNTSRRITPTTSVCNSWFPIWTLTSTSRSQSSQVHTTVMVCLIMSLNISLLQCNVQTKLRYIVEDQNIHNHCSENINCQIII